MAILKRMMNRWRWKPRCWKERKALVILRRSIDVDWDYRTKGCQNDVLPETTYPRRHLRI